MRGLRAAEQFQGGVGTSSRLDRLAKLNGHYGGTRLAALGQEDAAAQQAHRGDQFRQVRPRFRDGHALIVHKRTVANPFPYNGSRCNVGRMSAGTYAYVSCDHHDRDAPAGLRLCYARIEEGSTKAEARRAARKAGWLTAVHHDGTPGTRRLPGLWDFCAEHKPGKEG